MEAAKGMLKKFDVACMCCYLVLEMARSVWFLWFLFYLVVFWVDSFIVVGGLEGSLLPDIVDESVCVVLMVPLALDGQAQSVRLA
jgi:hypothetical protein